MKEKNMKITKGLVLGLVAVAAAITPVKSEARHCHGGWGRGGHHFWGGFAGGLVSGALYGSYYRPYYRPYYYTSPVVYTTPVVTTTYATTPVVNQVQTVQQPVQQVQAPVQQAPVQAQAPVQPSTLVFPNGTKITTSDPAVIQQYMNMMQNQQQNEKK